MCMWILFLNLILLNFVKFNVWKIQLPDETNPRFYSRNTLPPNLTPTSSPILILSFWLTIRSEQKVYIRILCRTRAWNSKEQEWRCLQWVFWKQPFWWRRRIEAEKWVLIKRGVEGRKTEWDWEAGAIKWRYL